MAELILTDDERRAALWSDLDDAALGKLVKKKIVSLTDAAAQLDRVTTFAAAMLLCCAAAEQDSSEIAMEIEGLTQEGREFGDWKVVATKALNIKFEADGPVSRAGCTSSADLGNTAAGTLARAGVYAGAHGLEGLANAAEFWEQQPYGTRLYYGPNAFDYLQIGVLKTAVELLAKMPSATVEAVGTEKAAPAADSYAIKALDAELAAAHVERERICAAIKAEDDHCADGDYMMDSDDCIAVARGTWRRPDWSGSNAPAPGVA